MTVKSAKQTEDPQAQPEQQQQAAARSPSPSALSTASSSSPLIRNHSTSSSTSSASSQRSSGGASSGSSQHYQQTRRPAPTSIAAAQLQQQLAKQQHQPQANKLAHMTRHQLPAGHKQQVNHRFQEGEEPAKSKRNSKSEGAYSNSKGFGYNLGKMIAYRASRFNEFWSVNKMRYMNLACLLMTLVCLLTILLFSKQSSRNVTESRQLERESQPRWSSKLTNSAASRRRLDGHSLQVDSESPMVESIDGIDRQPFVMSGTPRRRSTSDLDADSAAPDEIKREPLADKLSATFDDMLQDARRQLKLQQEIEREADETTTTSSTASSPSSETKANNETRKSLLSSSEPNLNQLFHDLDNFGLFKVIKSQLQSANLSQAGPTIVRKSPHGATIIMSLAGSSNASSLLDANSTTNPMGSLLERLLPPMFRPPSSLLLDDKSPHSKSSAPRGFATITIRSEPLIRGPLMPFSASPFSGPFGMRPSESLVNPFPVLSSHPAMGSPPDGLFSALLRATSELMADQMGQQQQQLSEALNKTLHSATSNSSTRDALSQQASHMATIVRLPGAAVNSTGGSGNSSTGTSGSESLDDEVETFDVGQLMSSRLAPAPLAFMRSPFSPLFRSLYAGPRAGRPGSIIINSRTSPSDGMLFDSPSGDFGSDSAPSPFSVLPSTPFAPSLMPHMIMFGSSGARTEGPAPMIRALLAATKQMEHREKEAPARRDDPEQDTGDSEPWDEQFANSGLASKLVAQHRSLSEPIGQDDEQPPFLSSMSSGSSSLIENMLESTNGGPPVGRVSGTIKQIFRGPGMTVERIIELPGNVQQVRQFRRAQDRPEVQAVAPGIRSQSISRMDDDSQAASGEYHKTASSQRVPNFAAQAQERSDPAELVREFVRPLGVPAFASVSRAPVGGLISRIFSDLNRHQESGDSFEGPLPSLHPLGSFLSGASSIFGPVAAKSQRQQRAFSERSMDDESENDSNSQEQDEDSEASQPVWSPKIRLGSARVRLSPLRHDQPLPTRFAVPAEPPIREEVSSAESRADHSQDNSRMQRAMKPAPIRSINEHHEHRQSEPKPISAFTSPNSSLFGFPAINAAVAGNKLQARASETSARPFVYHSNHELAGSMSHSSEPREQHQVGIESRSSYQHRSPNGVQSVAGVPAAIGMGRRLDESELSS